MFNCNLRYPCLNPKAEYNEEKVYSGTVACSRFLFNDRNIVTVGGTDASLMLWQLVEEQQKPLVHLPYLLRRNFRSDDYDENDEVVQPDSDEAEDDSDVDRETFRVLNFFY